MGINEVRDIIIPEIETFCGMPVIMADDMGDKPDGPHITYKITMSKGRGIGQGDEIFIPGVDKLQIQETKETRSTISFTAYALDDDVSRDMAQKIYDWFDFYGYEVLNELGVTISEITDISNRDTFIVENYERRNGFDVIIKMQDTKIRNVDYFDNVQGITTE